MEEICSNFQRLNPEGCSNLKLSFSHAPCIRDLLKIITELRQGKSFMHVFDKLCLQIAFKFGDALLLPLSTLETVRAEVDRQPKTVCSQVPFAFPFTSNRERWVDRYSCYDSIQCALYTVQTYLFPKKHYFIEVLNFKSKKQMKISVFIPYMPDLYVIEYNKAELHAWCPCLQKLS